MIPYLAAAAVATGLFIALLVTLWPRERDEVDDATLDPFEESQ